MRSSSFVSYVSFLQLIVGLSLLGIYESYKVSFINSRPASGEEGDEEGTGVADGKDRDLSRCSNLFSTPLDWLFYLSMFNNIFALFFCLAGVLNALKEVIAVFSIFNAIQVGLTFHFFVDIWTDSRIRNWSEGDLGSYEKAAAAFIFFNFFLSFASTVVAMKLLQEIRMKPRDEYNRLSAISDNHQFGTDNAKF